MAFLNYLIIFFLIFDELSYAKKQEKLISCYQIYIFYAFGPFQFSNLSFNFFNCSVFIVIIPSLVCLSSTCIGYIHYLQDYLNHL